MVFGGYTGPVPVTVEEQYAEYAAGELELWLRQNRTGPGWPWRGYEAEAEALTERYLHGVEQNWHLEEVPYAPGNGLSADRAQRCSSRVAGRMTPTQQRVADAVWSGAGVAWRRVTGTEPGGGARMDEATAELARKWAVGVDRLRRAG